MKKEASHTKSGSSSTLRLLPDVGMVDLADPGLSGRLAGKVSDQLETFASKMCDGPAEGCDSRDRCDRCELSHRRCLSFTWLPRQPVRVTH